MLVGIVPCRRSDFRNPIVAGFDLSFLPPGREESRNTIHTTPSGFPIELGMTEDFVWNDDGVIWNDTILFVISPAPVEGSQRGEVWRAIDYKLFSPRLCIKKMVELLMRNIFITLIKIYRAVISPIFPPSCRFQPTCSHYAEEAVKQHGVFWGGIMSAWRILRCNPFVRGGEDPVPETIEQWRKKWKKHSA